MVLSNADLEADGHRLGRGDMVKGGRILGVAGHEDEQAITPVRHATMPPSGEQVDVADEIVDLAHVLTQAQSFAVRKLGGHVGTLHESVAKDDAAKALAELEEHCSFIKILGSYPKPTPPQ